MSRGEISLTCSEAMNLAQLIAYMRGGYTVGAEAYLEPLRPALRESVLQDFHRIDKKLAPLAEYCDCRGK